MIGRTLSHYRILHKLGSGGMGEVYAAEDTKPGRKVALKVLPPETASNAERLERFEREARVVAALNHPNIVTLYSVEESEGVHFITMELVEGKTLTELIPKKGLPLNKFLEITIPLADAVGDNRSLLFHDRYEVYRLDSLTGDYQQILSVAPDVVTGPLEISRDSTRLYFSLRIRHANIWLLTLEQEH
jgi:serine/threonine protein kinase